MHGYRVWVFGRPFIVWAANMRHAARTVSFHFHMIAQEERERDQEGHGR